MKLRQLYKSTRTGTYFLVVRHRPVDHCVVFKNMTSGRQQTVLHEQLVLIGNNYRSKKP